MVLYGPDPAQSGAHTSHKSSITTCLSHSTRSRNTSTQTRHHDPALGSKLDHRLSIRGLLNQEDHVLCGLLVHLCRSDACKRRFNKFSTVTSDHSYWTSCQLWVASGLGIGMQQSGVAVLASYQRSSYSTLVALFARRDPAATCQQASTTPSPHRRR